LRVLNSVTQIIPRLHYRSMMRTQSNSNETSNIRGDRWGAFFVAFIFLTNITILNLFVGVIVDHIQHVANTTDLELMKEVLTGSDNSRRAWHRLSESQRHVGINIDYSFKLGESEAAGDV